MIRVLIVSAYPVLTEGLGHLLRANPQVEVLGQEADLDVALARIQEQQPDVVILEGRRYPGSEMEAVGRILKACPGLRIVHVDLADNTVCIYRGEHRIVQCFGDFLQALGLGHDLITTG